MINFNQNLKVIKLKSYNEQLFILHMALQELKKNNVIL